MAMEIVGSAKEPRHRWKALSDMGPFEVGITREGRFILKVTREDSVIYLILGDETDGYQTLNPNSGIKVREPLAGESLTVKFT